LKEIDSHSYDIVEDAPFLNNQNVPFKLLCDTFDKVSEQKGQNSKLNQIETLSRMFRSIMVLKPSQLADAYYFCTLKIAPLYEQNELGIGREILMKSISKSCGQSEK
jgi:hypothetical protein